MARPPIVQHESSLGSYSSFSDAIYFIKIEEFNKVRDLKTRYNDGLNPYLKTRCRKYLHKQTVSSKVVWP